MHWANLYEKGGYPKLVKALRVVQQASETGNDPRQTTSLAHVAMRARELLPTKTHEVVLRTLVQEGVSLELADAALSDALLHWRSRR